MMKRILTAVVGLIIFFAVLILPPVVFYIAVCLVILGMLYEVHKAVNAGTGIGIASVLSAALLFFGMVSGDMIPAMIVSVMIYLAAAVALHERENIKTVLTSGFLTWFIVVFMSSIMIMRHDFGIYGVLLIFLCAWITDTCAYFTGYCFGKHKLIPKVSPKKTVEGAVGGVVGTMIFCMLYAFILTVISDVQGTVTAYLTFAVLGIIASVLAQLGDLSASALKRDCGIKDFGTIFPGHGGILDRFDSVVFIAPFIYYFVSYLSML